MVNLFTTARRTPPAGCGAALLALITALPLSSLQEAAPRESGEAVPARAEEARRISVSGEQALEIAADLVARGALEEAEAIVDPLIAAAGENVDQTQARFLKGMIAASREDYGAAEAIFRRILRDRPELVRIRLELARVLYEQEKDIGAAYHFRFALGQNDLPTETRANVRRFLTLIEDRRMWKASVSLAFQPSTNVNAAPDDPTISQYGIPGLTLRDEDTSQSGMGVTAAASIAAFPRLNSRVRLEARAGLRYTDHEESRFDDAFATVEAGPRFRAGRYMISALASASLRHYGGAPYSTSHGARLVIATPLAERTRFIMRGGLHHTAYDTASARDGLTWSAGGTIAHIVDRRTRADIGLSVTREEAEAGSLKNTQYQAHIGLSREFAHGISAAVRPEYIYRHFDEPDPNLGAGLGIGAPGALPEREDRIWILNVQMTKRDWYFRGFAPVFGYSYLTSESTNDLYNYDRHSAELALTREF